MDLHEERTQLRRDLEALDRVAGNRALSGDEQAQWDEKLARISEIDGILARRTAMGGISDDTTEQVEERAAAIEDPEDPKAAEARTLAHTEPTGGGAEARVSVNEASPYSPERGPEARSFYRDALAAANGDGGARETLHANARVQWSEASASERVMLTDPDSAGGFYAPPKHLVNLAADLLREQAEVASTFNTWTHPGARHITIPVVTAGVSVESQPENEPLPKSAQTIDEIDVYNERIKGTVEASAELLSFAATSVDQILTQDLVSAYVEELERQVIDGRGHATYNELPGLLRISGTQPVTFTDGGDVDIEQVAFWQAILKGKGLVRKPGKRRATHVAMAPRRRTWFLGGFDDNGRPLSPVVAAQNALANVGGSSETIDNMTVVESGLFPENLGAGTDEDRAIVYYAPDFWLAQGAMQISVQRDTPITVDGEVHLKDNAIFKLTRDVMLVSERRPSSAAVIGGTGMALTL
jgi:HK97 family phage major capsid protein